MNEEVSAFKNLLSNYSKYKNVVIPKLKDEIEDLEYRETGVKAIRYDRTPGTFNQSASNMMRYKLMDEIEAKKIKLSLYQSVVDYCDSVLNKLKKRDEIAYDFLIAKYVDGKTYKEIKKKMYYSESTIWEKIEKSLNRNL